MPLDTQLRGLLERWDELRDRGKTPTPEDLCRDCPERVDEMRALVRDLLALAPPGDTISEPAPSANGDGPAPNEVASESRYRPLRLHAKGGQGEVYLAEDKGLNREVALKRIQPRHAGRADAIRRFLREAVVCGRLQHPGIVPVYARGLDADGLPYYAMRFIEGESLKAAIERFHKSPRFSSLEFRRLLQRFVSVCETVAYAHNKGVVHRDLKPANIMLGPFGETLVVDWGLAKLTDSGAGSGSNDSPVVDGDTRAGAVIGTPAYMAPEQARGEPGRVGPAADVYSLGATLGELVGDHAPPALQAVCHKAMAAEPAARYASATELAADVEHWLADEPVGAWREPVWLRLRRWVRRHTRLTTGVTAALAVAAIASGVVAALLTAANKRERAAKETAQAREAETRAVLGFVQNKVFAAARPEGRDGGLGYKVTLRQAVETALPFVEANFRDQPLVEAKLRITLGTSFWYLGAAETAARQFEAARTILSRLLGPDHPDTLQSMHGVVIAYYDLGRYADSLRICEQTLNLRRLRLGPDHPDTLRSLQSLATNYAALGRYGDALKVREDVLARRKTVLGPDDSDTLLSMNDLAASYKDLGRHVESARILEEAVSRYDANLDPGHPDKLECMINLGVSYSALGRPSEALRLREETLALCKARLGPDHTYTLQSMDYLAASLAAAGRLPEAVRLREEAVERQRAKLGADHPFTLIGLNNLASMYAKAGRHGDALRLREETLTLQQAKFGPDHPQTLIAMANLADSLVTLGRGKEALPIIDECLERAGRKTIDPRVVPFVMDLRLRHFEKAKDAAGCRATAEMWENQNRPDAGSLYTAACFRAVAAGVAVAPGAPAAGLAQDDADRAMAWLRKALTAGYRDIRHLVADPDFAPLRRRADYVSVLWDLADAPAKSP